MNSSDIPVLFFRKSELKIINGHRIKNNSNKIQFRICISNLILQLTNRMGAILARETLWHEFQDSI